MKKLIFLFFISISFISVAQEGYIFSNDQHEQIKKNLSDYKILIKEYDSLNKEFIKLKNLHSQHRCDTINVFRLKKENEDLKKTLLLKEKEIKYKTRMMYHFEWKYIRERKKRKRPTLY